MALTKFLASLSCTLLCTLILTTSTLAQQTDQYDKVDAFANAVNSVYKDVQENCKITQSLSESDLANLPIGIAPQGCGGGTTIIVIDSAYRSDRGQWFFSVYASVVFPGTTHPIAFAAKNVAFNEGGLTTSTQVKLLLVSKQVIRINDNLVLELPAEGKNFVEFDCNGFKGINIRGNFIFSDGILQPDTDMAPGATNVTATLDFYAHDLNDIKTAVSITPFKIRGIDDVSFEIKNAVCDYSDFSNPDGFSFPQGYQQAYGENINLWRGFYMQNATVRIKVGVDSAGSSQPIRLSAYNLIIDDLGVSGKFSVGNPLPLKDGSADGWPFSIDELSVQLTLNRITGGGLKGKLGVPFLGDDPAPYVAQVEQGTRGMNYLFSISTTEDKVFDAPFSSKVRLDAGSTITLERTEDGRFIPSARLNGALSTGGMVQTDRLKFENLILSARKPYVLGGTFAVSTMSIKASAAGFSITIDSIKLKIYPGIIGLGLRVSLNLSNSSSGGDQNEKSFSASTSLEILSKLEENKTIIPASGDLPERTKTNHKWKFDRVKINQIKLAIHTQSFNLDGTLDFYKDDPTYGDGFHGFVVFGIKSVIEGISVNIYFGTKQGKTERFRYWHMDGYVPIGQLPIYPPVLYITGFMGGASYRMVRGQPLIPDFTKVGNLNEDTPPPEPAGLVYVPDETAGISFLAGVSLMVVNDNAVSADVMFEVAFNVGGGLKYVRFDGSVYIMAEKSSRPRGISDQPAGLIFANMSMLYDNDNKVFHANVKTYINMFGVLTGVGPNGLVGEAVIHIDQRDWYTYVGRPSQMFGVSLLGIVSIETYFMMGTKIENLPLPPREVQEIFGNVDLSLMRDDMAAAGGSGFAAGLRMKIGFDSGDELNPFYLGFVIGGGTDVMVRNYGNVQCMGRDGKIGIDGWYASGQAYVFMVGKIGLRVKKKSFDIVTVGLAALLQANLPNPAWLRGMVAGHYSVLGGLVKGRFNLKFVVGEECEMMNQGSEIADVVVIADMKPTNGGNEVNVFTAPQVSFNTAINTDFTMMDLNQIVNSYRIKLDELSLTNGGATVEGSIKWNDAKDVAIFKTREILPQKSTLKFFAKIHWEKKSGNGMWEIMQVEGQDFYEVKEITFNTGAAPNFIPEENVAYSYPIKNQYNLHINETGEGYVKLEYGQEYLFTPVSDDGKPWNYIARFKSVKGTITETPLTYKANEMQAGFSIPTALQKETIYTLTFVKRPQQEGSVDKNVVRTEVTKVQDADNEMTTNSNTLEGTLALDVEKVIYSQSFRTSRFATFAEKWTSLGNGNDLFDVARGTVAVIGKKINTAEAFDAFELKGKENVEPLVQVMASPNNPWMNQVIAPLLYDLYPYDSEIKLEWRDPSELGVKPLRGVKLTNSVEDFILTDANISAGNAPAKNGTALIGYYLSFYSFWDYSELINKVSAKYLDNWDGRPEGARRLLTARGYTDLLEGYYPVDVVYSLPGTNTVTYRTQVMIKF